MHTAERYHDISCGVYAIEHIASKQCYIGSSINIAARFKNHNWMLKSGKHHSKHLQHAWDLYGKEAFQHRILKLCNESNLEQEEQEFIKEFGTFNSCKFAGPQKRVYTELEKQIHSDKIKLAWSKGKLYGTSRKGINLGLRRTISKEGRNNIKTGVIASWSSGERKVPVRNPCAKDTKEKISLTLQKYHSVNRRALCKLTIAQELEICASNETTVALGKKLGVDASTISRIRKKRLV